MVLAAAIARSTRRMQIGITMMVLPFQHPLRVAELSKRYMGRTETAHLEVDLHGLLAPKIMRYKGQD